MARSAADVRLSYSVCPIMAESDAACAGGERFGTACGAGEVLFGYKRSGFFGKVFVQAADSGAGRLRYFNMPTQGSKQKPEQGQSKNRNEEFIKIVDTFPPFYYNINRIKSINFYRIIAARRGKAKARFRCVRKIRGKGKASVNGNTARRGHAEAKTYREVKTMVLKVCVGSSCHLRGSYDVIEEMKRLIKKYGVEDKIDLQATFCVGNCTNGVSVLADELLLHNANKDNCEELFLTQVYPLVK